MRAQAPLSWRVCLSSSSTSSTRRSRKIRHGATSKSSSVVTRWVGLPHIALRALKEESPQVPGEGEHKIMEYIRSAKAQPEYDPNVRHCLYGLDADLVMLALLSHDPHFCLLREEVTFGPKRTKSKGGLESQNFYLLHISLFREYLDLEFSSLREPDSQLPFAYDLERIIDDFILLCIFVGNDFLPHLPGLHINEGAFPMLFGIYKRVLPRAGGYLNEYGTLHTGRLQLVLDELRDFESKNFEHEFADSSWFKGKQSKHIEALERARARAPLVLTSQQRALFERVKTFARSALLAPSSVLEIPATLPARDRRFLSDLANELRLDIAFDAQDAAGEPAIAISLDQEVAALANEDLEGDGHANGGSNAEANLALDRVLQKYERAPTVKIPEGEDLEADYERRLEEKMTEWRAEYYRVCDARCTGLSLSAHDHRELRTSSNSTTARTRTPCIALLSRGSRASNGSSTTITTASRPGAGSTLSTTHPRSQVGVAELSCCAGWRFLTSQEQIFQTFRRTASISSSVSPSGRLSSSWAFYRISAPRTSLWRSGSAFAQRPSTRSQADVTVQDLMSDPESPILDFYPRAFEADLNGKKQDWEAVVKIPFIDERRLIAAMKRAPLTESSRGSR